MGFIQRLTFTSLFGYIAVTTSLGTGGLYLYGLYLRKKFAEAGYFKRTVKIIESNSTIKKLMGHPIKFGMLDLGDNRKFYSTDEKAFFVVAAKGPYDSGIVTSYSLRTPSSGKPSDDSPEESEDGIPNDGWEPSRVEIRVSKHKDKRLIVFRKPEADEKFVETFHDFFMKDPPEEKSEKVAK